MRRGAKDTGRGGARVKPHGGSFRSWRGNVDLGRESNQEQRSDGGGREMVRKPWWSWSDFAGHLLF